MYSFFVNTTFNLLFLQFSPTSCSLWGLVIADERHLNVAENKQVGSRVNFHSSFLWARNLLWQRVWQRVVIHKHLKENFYFNCFHYIIVFVLNVIFKFSKRKKKKKYIYNPFVSLESITHHTYKSTAHTRYFSVCLRDDIIWKVHRWANMAAATLMELEALLFPLSPKLYSVAPTRASIHAQMFPLEISLWYSVQREGQSTPSHADAPRDLFWGPHFTLSVYSDNERALKPCLEKKNL